MSQELHAKKVWSAIFMSFNQAKVYVSKLILCASKSASWNKTSLANSQKPKFSAGTRLIGLLKHDQLIKMRIQIYDNLVTTCFQWSDLNAYPGLIKNMISVSLHLFMLPRLPSPKLIADLPLTSKKLLDLPYIFSVSYSSGGLKTVILMAWFPNSSRYDSRNVKTNNTEERLSILYEISGQMVITSRAGTYLCVIS